MNISDSLHGLNNKRMDWKQHYRSGCSAYRSNDLVRAERELSLAIQLNPTCLQIYTSRASLLGKSGRHMEVIKDGKRMLELDPENAIVGLILYCSASRFDFKGYLFCAKAYRQLQQYEHAQRVINKGLAMVSSTSDRYPELVQQRQHLDCLKRENQKPTVANESDGPSAQTSTSKRQASRQTLNQPEPARLDFVLKLPYELLALIFEQVDFRTRIQCCRVSKGWRNFLTSCSLLWTHLDLSKRGRKVQDKHLYSLLSLGKHHVRELNLAGCSAVTERGLHALAKNKCRQLEQLDLSDIWLHEYSKLAETLRIVEKVRLVEGQGMGSGLVILSLSSEQLKDEQLIMVLMSCPNLKDLNLSKCPNVTGEILESYKFRSMKPAMIMLEKLNISYCARWTDFALKNVFKLWHSSLTHLDISMSPRLTTDGIMDLGLCTALRSIKMGRMFTGELEVHLPDVLLASGETWLKHIQEMAIFRSDRLDDVAIEHLLTHSQSISLDFDGTARITNASAITIAQTCGQRLKHLCLSDCPGITKEGYMAIARSCSVLEHLDLSCNDAVDDKCLRELAVHCKTLRELAVRSCRFHGSGLLELCRSSPHLRKLDMRSCTSIPNEMVQLIKQSLPKRCVVNARLYD